MTYALINEALVVVNTVLADADFAAFIAPEWAHVVRIDELDPHPGIDWTYDENTGDFTQPAPA